MGQGLAACWRWRSSPRRAATTTTTTPPRRRRRRRGDFTACQVTDTGGVDDRSFNQTAFKGLEDAADELGFEPQVLESQSEADFAPNIQALIDQGCNLVVTVGFLLGDATATAAEANPDQLFAIVDNDLFDTEAEEDRNFDNVAELTFATDQAAFLAGYVAAAMTETGTVGTYGGINLPTVNIFMKGFQLGIEQYNDDNGTDVQLIGWDNADPDGGLFTGDFEDQAKGRPHRDAHRPGRRHHHAGGRPGGPGLDRGHRGRRRRPKPIWVDTDGCVSVEESCDLFLTSVMKNMDVAVNDVRSPPPTTRSRAAPTRHARERRRGIAPFHEFEDAGPAGAQGPARGTAPADHRRRDRDVAGRLSRLTAEGRAPGYHQAVPRRRGLRRSGSRRRER